MAILITGGAGYIGSHTMVEFLEAGRELVVVDNFLNSKPEALERVRKITGKDFKFFQVDLLDYDALNKVFEENDIDSCIHFAGLKAVATPSSQEAAIEVILKERRLELGFEGFVYLLTGTWYYRAIGIYKKFGFEKAGQNEKFFKINGEFFSADYMNLYL